MPKKVDHDVRRAELADALWKVACSDGWDGLSLRKIAAAAGVSLGLVQHYFTTKDELLRYAMRVLDAVAIRRLDAAIDAIAETCSPRAFAELVLVELLPRFDRGDSHRLSAQAHLRRFEVFPETIRPAEECELGVLLAEQLARGRPGRPADVVRRDAAGLIALLDGLVFGIVHGQHSFDMATAIMRAQLDHLFPGSPRPGSRTAHRRRTKRNKRRR